MPETANKLGIERGDIVEVSTASGKVRAPAYLYLGIRLDTIALAIGREHCSSVAKLDEYDGRNDKSHRSVASAIRVEGMPR